MNRLKRLYIYPFLLGLLLALIHALIALYGDARSVAWWSVVVSCGSMLAFFVYLGASKVASTSENLPVLLALQAVAVFMALVDFRWLPGLYTLLLGAGGSLLYIFWYSRLDRQLIDDLAIGATLPEFEFRDSKGKLISSKAFTGKTTIFLFYRGSWCPLCVAQVKAVCDQYRTLHNMGVEVVLISPQSQDDTRKLAQKFDVPLVFGFDEHRRAARRLGIVHAEGLPPGLNSGESNDTVMPTVIIIDDTGRILWTHATDNYRVRPDPALFLQVIQQQAGV